MVALVLCGMTVHIRPFGVLINRAVATLCRQARTWSRQSARRLLTYALQSLKLFKNSTVVLPLRVVSRSWTEARSASELVLQVGSVWWTPISIKGEQLIRLKVLIIMTLLRRSRRLATVEKLIVKAGETTTPLPLLVTFSWLLPIKVISFPQGLSALLVTFLTGTFLALSLAGTLETGQILFLQGQLVVRREESILLRVPTI